MKTPKSIRSLLKGSAKKAFQAQEIARIASLAVLGGGDDNHHVQDDTEYETIYRECRVLSIQLTLHQGDGLAAKDKNALGKADSSDPYCIVEVYPKGVACDHEKKVYGRSPTLPKTLSPVWNHTFETIHVPMEELDLEESVLRVQIMDDDFGVEEDDPLGAIDVYLQARRSLTVREKWYAVSRMSASQASGRLQISLQTTPNATANIAVGKQKKEKHSNPNNEPEERLQLGQPEFHYDEPEESEEEFQTRKSDVAALAAIRQRRSSIGVCQQRPPVTRERAGISSRRASSIRGPAAFDSMRQARSARALSIAGFRDGNEEQHWEQEDVDTQLQQCTSTPVRLRRSQSVGQGMGQFQHHNLKESKSLRRSASKRSSRALGIPNGSDHCQQDNSKDLRRSASKRSSRALGGPSSHGSDHQRKEGIKKSPCRRSKSFNLDLFDDDDLCQQDNNKDLRRSASKRSSRALVIPSGNGSDHHREEGTKKSPCRRSKSFNQDVLDDPLCQQDNNKDLRRSTSKRSSRTLGIPNGSDHGQLNNNKDPKRSTSKRSSRMLDTNDEAADIASSSLRVSQHKREQPERTKKIPTRSKSLDQDLCQDKRTSSASKRSSSTKNIADAPATPRRRKTSSDITAKKEKVMTPKKSSHKRQHNPTQESKSSRRSPSTPSSETPTKRSSKSKRKERREVPVAPTLPNDESSAPDDDPVKDEDAPSPECPTEEEHPPMVITVDSPHVATSPESSWTCVCGFVSKSSANFCGMCATRQYWTCAVPTCQYEENKCFFRFCAVCGTPGNITPSPPNWECPECLFEDNFPCYQYCSMCAAPKPTATKQSQAMQEQEEQQGWSSPLSVADLEYE